MDQQFIQEIARLEQKLDRLESVQARNQKIFLAVGLFLCIVIGYQCSMTTSPPPQCPVQITSTNVSIVEETPITKKSCSVRIVGSQLQGGQGTSGMLDWIKHQLNSETQTFSFDGPSTILIHVAQYAVRIHTSINKTEMEQFVDEGEVTAASANHTGIQHIVLVPVWLMDSKQAEPWMDEVEFSDISQLDQRAYSLVQNFEGIPDVPYNINKMNALKHRLMELC